MRNFVVTFQPCTIERRPQFESMKLSIFDERCQRYEFQARKAEEIGPVVESLGQEYIKAFIATFEPGQNAVYGSVRLANRGERKPPGFDKHCGQGFKIPLKEAVAA